MHPQLESYRGYINTIGLRSCYDEGKRIAKTLCFYYRRMHGTEIRVALIFNTYGPRMLPVDGRVVCNFIVQTLRGEPLTLCGSGSQSRSFCYVDDLVEGLIRLMNRAHTGSINISKPGDLTIRQMAELVCVRINPELPLIKKPMPADDTCNGNRRSRWRSMSLAGSPRSHSFRACLRSAPNYHEY